MKRPERRKPQLLYSSTVSAPLAVLFRGGVTEMSCTGDVVRLSLSPHRDAGGMERALTD